MRLTFVFILLIGSTSGFSLNPSKFIDFLKSFADPDTTTVPPTSEGYPFPTFLIDSNVTKEDLKKWFEIQRNLDATKGEILADEDAWVATQNEDTKTKFNEWRASINDFMKSQVAEGDQAVSELSESAQDIYNQVQKVRFDDSITRVEECEKIRSIFQTADQLDLVELLRVVPGIRGRCFGPYPIIGGYRSGNREDNNQTNSNNNYSSNNTSTNNNTNNNNSVPNPSPNPVPRENSLGSTTFAPPAQTTTASKSFLRRLFGF